MGNDNKIKKETGSVKLFLDDELVLLKQQKDQIYDLEEEFAKTKKNHSGYITLTLFLCFLGVSGLVYGAYRLINSKEYTMQITGGSIDSVVTENIEEEIRRTQSLYQESLSYIKQIAELEKKELAEAERQYNFDIYAIDSMNIEDKKDLKKRKESAKNDYKKNVQEIKEQYAQKKQKAHEDSVQYKNKLDSYSEQALKNASEDSSLNQEQILQKLEKEQLINNYEKRIEELEKKISDEREKALKDKKASLDMVSSKYQKEISGLDPELRDKKALTLIESNASFKRADFTAGNYSSLSKVYSQELLSALQKADELYDQYKYLYGTYSSLPQKNSIPGYIKTANNLVIQASNMITDTAVQTVNELSQQVLLLQTTSSTVENLLYTVMQSAGYKAIVLTVLPDRLEVLVNPEVQTALNRRPLPASVQPSDTIVHGTLTSVQNHFYFTPTKSEHNSLLAMLQPGVVLEVGE